MDFEFDARASDSPLVDYVWRTVAVHTEAFTSTASTQWEMVFTKQRGVTTVSVRGPETHASPAPVPENAEFFGIVFKPGAFMPNMPVNQLVDKGLNIPELTGQSFWLLGASWQVPTYENADTFINRMMRE